MEKYIFKSERLGFRLWEDKDITPFTQINLDEDVMEFFPKTQAPEVTLNFIERTRKHFEAHGFGWYAIDILETKQFIGFLGLTTCTFEADFTPCYEIGWRFGKEFWGRGYATEGALRCLEYGFEVLGFEEVYSFTATLNNRSERVMQKIGMTKVGEFDHPKIEKGHILERHLLYKILKSEMDG